MHSLTTHDDVLRVELFTARSRVMGYGVSMYLVRGTLVDTGFHAVRRAVAHLVDERRPAGALVTHYHEDHAGNVELLARRGVPLDMGAETEARLRDVKPIGFYRRYTWHAMPPLTSPRVPYAPAGLAMLHLPGHSSDHHVVWDAERRTLFSGDLFLGVKVRIMHPAEDPYVLERSLRTAAALAPERLFCAHRGPVPNPVQALLAKADWTAETIAAVERRIADGSSDDAITRDVLEGESFTGWVSRGDYARRNFVKAVRRGMAVPGR